MSVKKLAPGQAVRVEHNTRIVAQVENNPYWYVVEYSNGERETVSLSRINAIVDTSKAVLGQDCSIQIFSPRLSADGALDLLIWLQTHEHDLRFAIQENDVLYK